MDTWKKNIYFNYLLVLIFLVTGTLSLYRLSIKPAIPLDYSDSVTVINIDGIYTNSTGQVEFYIDSKNIGDDVNVTYVNKDGIVHENKLKLVSYYTDPWFILITAITGFIFILTGMFILARTIEDPATRALFRILVLFGIANLTTPGKYFPEFDIIAYFIRTLHITGYILGSIAFLHFINVFPKKVVYNKKHWLTAYTAGLLISLAFSGHTIYSIQHAGTVLYNATDIIWRLTETFLLLSIITGVAILIIKYRKLNNNEKRQVEWIFWGLTFGVIPDIVFWVIPSVLKIQPPIKEEILLLTLIFVPLSFAAAVIKYRILDITLIIKRSIVYSLMSGIIIALFYIIAAVLGLFIKSATGSSDFVFLGAAFFIIIIFNPLRVKLQRFVDKRFYRADYNLRNILTGFNLKIKDSVSIYDLCSILCNEINTTFYPKRICIALRSGSGERLKLISQINSERIKLKADISRLKLPLNDISNIDHNNVILNESGLLTHIPIASEKDDIHGYIMIGDKISETKFTNDELMLIEALASSSAIMITKLQLQERVIIEELELDRLNEINKMKSEFISGVTHELQTPLTSIKLFAETMLDERIKDDEKKNNYLKIITAESDRLSRMINNVLDFSKIERNIKNYVFEETDLIRIAEYVLSTLQFQINRAGFDINIHKELQVLKIYADSDAVAEAITNVITNALKYGTQKKKIEVHIYVDSKYGVIDIQDHGFGIPAEEQPFVFNTYYRSNLHSSGKVKGLGIGLSIVKHIMDSHLGKIVLESESGKGCCFSLYFPKNKPEEYEKNPNN